MALEMVVIACRVSEIDRREDSADTILISA